MKWINLWVKNFADYIYTKLPSIQHHDSYFAQKPKISGSQGKETDFEMSVPSCIGCVAS